MLLDAVSHALERCPKQVASGVGQAQAKDDALGPGVVHRCSLTREVGQNNDTAGPDGCFCSLAGQNRIGGLAAFSLGGNQVGRKAVAEPAGECTRGCHASKEAPGAGEQIRRSPQSLVPGLVVIGDLDDEDGRAIHQHHFTGLGNPDAERFSASVDGAHRHGCSNVQACFLSGPLGDATG